MMLDQIESLIIIVGCQRSGTTLCGQILGAPKGCLLIDEPDGLYPWFDKTQDGKLYEGELIKSVLNRANQKYKPAHKRTNHSGSAVALKPEIRHLVLKAPNLTYDLERLSSLDLPVKIIFPVRDPKAVVASMIGLDFMVQMDQRQIEWAERFDFVSRKYVSLIDQLKTEEEQHKRLAIVWKLKTGLTAAFKGFGLNPLIFRYEDLVEDPKTYKKRIFEHAGLENEPVDYSDIFQGRGPGLTDRERPIDTVSVEKWQRRLTMQQIQDVMEETEDVAYAYGYERPDSEFCRPSVPQKDLAAPIVLLGRGGSGTRLLSEIVQSCGVFLGNRLNGFGDSVEWVDAIYELGSRRTLPSSGHAMEDEQAVDLLKEKASDILLQGNWRKSQLWGWKLPETMLIVPDVAQAFPEARFIHLVRHPVTSSLRRTHMTSRPDNPIGRAVLTAAYREAGQDEARIHTDEDYLRNAYTWLYQVGRVHEYCQRRAEADSYLLLKYESFLSDQVEASKSIHEFIGSDKQISNRLVVEKNRAAYHAREDPRIEEVWSICGDVALTLGYTSSEDY